MKNKYRLLQSTRIHLLQRGLLAALAAMLFALPVASNAQEITGTVRGTVTTSDGLPAAGATVTITDTRTNTRRTVTTGANGAFTIRGLGIGGPFNIRVASSQYQDTLVTDVYTNLSSAVTFDIALGEAGAIEEIITTARMVQTADLAIGPGSSFSLADIEAMPSIARQIRDIVRSDPRVQLGRNGNGAGSGINCMGGSPRMNAITIDGTLVSDGFGLNAGTGSGTRFQMPVPFDTIISASVEFAPLDVQYSQFTGCAINIVTKTGSNEFHGSAFYLYNDDSLTGSKLEGRRVITDPFEEKNIGFDFSGPIIKDKLFFTLTYEEVDDVGTFSLGPTGAGFANELSGIDLATANEIADIMLAQYGRDVGYIVRTLPFESESTFVRLDWNIDDRHRAEFTYSKLDELNLDPDDCCTGFDGFTFSDNFELEGSDRETISVRVFSNWTDNFSTEFRYFNVDLVDIQGPLAGGEEQDPNPKVRLAVQDGSGDPMMLSGPGFSRSANDLSYTIDGIKLSADYVMGDHTLTFGFEQESRDIFNLFIQNATGTIQFADVAALQAGTALSVNINGSYTQDPRDASATFARDINSFYLQDEWQVNDAVTMIAGVRFDEYTSNDLPTANPVFEARYGFDNTQTFDGLSLFQPRIGVTWDLPTSKWGSTQLSAGFGVFGGGDPTVHFANAYQNFGGAIGSASYGSGQFDAQDAPCTDLDLQVTDAGGQFTGLPDCIRIAAANSANANTGPVAAVDPNYNLPSNHRWSFGINHVLETNSSFFNDWEIQFDIIQTAHKDPIDWVDLRLTPNGVILPDGRSQFFEVDPLQAGCMATFNGIGQGFSNAGTNGGPCDDVSNSNQDIVMTNGREGSTTSISLQLAKTFEYSDMTSLNIGFGYAYLDAEVANPVTSFTAGSSYENAARINVNDIPLGPAFWASEHNIVLSMKYKHYWNDDNATSIGLFWQRRSGRPFSYTYEDDTVEDLFGESDDEESILIYVPTGTGDPIYDFTTNVQASCSGGTCYTQADVDDFFAFLDSSGLSKYAGRISPKNGFEGPWHTDIDIRITQDIGLFKDHRLQVFLDIENVLNLFGSKQNLRRYTNTGDIPEGVRTLQLDTGETSVYVVEDIFFEGTLLDVDDSLYKVQLGVRYNF